MNEKEDDRNKVSDEKSRILAVIGILGLILFAALFVYGVMKNADSQKTSRQEDTISQNLQEKKKLGTIVLDAGHGGADGGKVGINQALEKDINLSLTKILKGILEEKGFQVIMTRETDENLGDADASNKKMEDLNCRIEIIEQADPLMVVSIHQNSYTQEGVSGAQVFYFKGSENGKNLAQCIQSSILKNVEMEKQREIKENDNYYLLKNTGKTMVIVECGFLSNRREADLLIQPQYQQKMANAIAEGIIDFYNKFEYNESD